MSDNQSTASGKRQGEIYAAGMVFLESWFPIAAAISVTAIGGLHAYFYSLVVAVLGLLVWWLSRRKFSDLKQSHAYFPLAMTSLFITTLFALVFVALQYTSAINVAIILFLQVLFSYLFLGRKPGEQLNYAQVWGAVFMTFGALLVLFPGKIQLQVGDFLVLLAAMISPFANLYQKRARKFVSSPTVLLVRSILALPVIYGLAVLLEPTPSSEQLMESAGALVFVGIMIFFLSKVLWIEAIHRLQITKVLALFAFAPLMTMLWSWWFLAQAPHWFQVLGALPICLGAYWITSGRIPSLSFKFYRD